MSKAKCYRCGGSASGDTYEQARHNINHAVGLSQGKPCGDSYGCVEEIKSEPIQVTTTSPPPSIPQPPIETKKEKPKQQTEFPKTEQTKKEKPIKKLKTKEKYL